MRGARSPSPISTNNFQRIWRAVFLLLLFATSTSAVDLRVVPIDAPHYSPAPARNWTGWDIGSGDASTSGLGTTRHINGSIAGGLPVNSSRPPTESPGEFITNFAAEPKPDAPRRANDAFAALSYAPMPTKAPPRIPFDEGRASPPSNSVLIFGGKFTTDNLGNSLNPFSAHHEEQRIVAAAYGYDFYHAPHGFVVGAEIGVGFRFGFGNSEELWAGVNFRHTGFVVFDLVRIAGGITVGLSAITNPTGVEAVRQTIDHGNARLLAYLGPELTIALLQYPNLELVYRVQHRSGAYGLIANFIEGANANVFGIRYRF